MQGEIEEKRLSSFRAYRSRSVGFWKLGIGKGNGGGGLQNGDGGPLVMENETRDPAFFHTRGYTCILGFYDPAEILAV